MIENHMLVGQPQTPLVHLCQSCCNTGRAWISKDKMRDWFSSQCFKAEKGEISKTELLKVCSLMMDWLGDGDQGHTVPCPEGCGA